MDSLYQIGRMAGMEDIARRLRSWVNDELQESDPAAVINQAANEIERLRAGRRWIPVSERLPEDDQQCLTVDKDGVQRVARFDAIGDGERHSWYEEQEWKSVYPVAWMPLPEPPEAK